MKKSPQGFKRLIAMHFIEFWQAKVTPHESLMKWILCSSCKLKQVQGLKIGGVRQKCLMVLTFVELQSIFGHQIGPKVDN